MLNLVIRFITNESGATAIEYGLIASLIGVAIIVAVTSVGTALKADFAAAALAITP
jgi:pilus assembly protein Flp/PilA